MGQVKTGVSEWGQTWGQVKTGVSEWIWNLMISEAENWLV